jgi:CRP-like cAMP-binding protein
VAAMAEHGLASMVADKLKVYGVSDDQGVSAPSTPSESRDREKRWKESECETPVQARSVYFVDERTGEISRPGTGARDRPQSRPGSRDSACETTLPNAPAPPSPRASILRPQSGTRPAGGRPRSSVQSSEVVPRPPPKRTGSGGSGTPSPRASRPSSRDSLRPSKAASTAEPQDRAEDVFSTREGPPSAGPASDPRLDLEPLAGFGVDVSMVKEEEAEDLIEPTMLGAGELLLVAGEGGGDLSFVDVGAGVCVEEKVEHRVILVGEEDSEAPEVDDEDGPGPEPADVPERTMIRVLRFVKWFKEMSMHELRDVARAGLPIFYPQGTTIVAQGDDGDSMCVVIRGKARLDSTLRTGSAAAQRNQVYVLEEGGTFGESAIVWVEPEPVEDDDDEIYDEDKWWKPIAVSDGWTYTVREFTVVAETDCEVLELPRRRLLQLMDDQKSLHRLMRVLYERTRAAMVVQRFYREYAAGKDAAKKMADMLSRAAAAMAAELKSLTPHAQAYMAMMGTMSHSAATEHQVATTPPPLRRPAGYVSRTQQAAQARGACKSSRSRGTASSVGSRRNSMSAQSKTGGGMEMERDRAAGMPGSVASPVLEGDEEEELREWEQGGAALAVADEIQEAGDDGRESHEAGRAQGGAHDGSEAGQAVGWQAAQSRDGDGGGQEEAKQKAANGSGLGGKETLAMRTQLQMKRLLNFVRRRIFRKRDPATGAEGGGTTTDVAGGGGRERGVGVGVEGEQDQGESGGEQQWQGEGQKGSSKPKSALRPTTRTSTSSLATGVRDWRERNWTLLVVTVIQCQELPRRNYRGALGAPVDATLEVSVDDVRYSIPAPIKHTCAPYFNETFVFQVCVLARMCSLSRICFLTLNWDVRPLSERNRGVPAPGA